MSKAKNFLHKGLSNQEGLFDSSLKDSGLDLRMPFRDMLSQALRQSNQSRWHVAAEASRLSGHELSKDMLDKVTSSNFDYGLRAEDLPAILYVIGSLEPARVLFRPIGCEILDANGNKLVRLAELEFKSTRLQSEIERLRKELGIKK